MQVEPSQNLTKSRWLNRRWFLTAFCAIGLGIAWGSDRQPADATKPVEWYRVSSKYYDTRPPEVLRIASYNIHSGKGRDRRLDLERIAADLKDIDFAGLYEVRSRSFGLLPGQHIALSDQLGMPSVFLATEHRWWHDHFGNAVLTYLPVQNIQRIPLIGTRGKAFRQAVLVEFPWQEQTLRILMVHIDSDRDREQQLMAVIRLFQSLESPCVLMGDLNTRSTDPRLAELLAHPGVESVIHTRLGEQAPTNNIDWIITRGLECVHAEYVDSGASDHPVVKADLRLPDASAKRR